MDRGGVADRGRGRAHLQRVRGHDVETLRVPLRIVAGRRGVSSPLELSTGFSAVHSQNVHLFNRAFFIEFAHEPVMRRASVDNFRGQMLSSFLPRDLGDPLNARYAGGL